MWNCSLKSLLAESGLITVSWQAKRNIANQIHKKVGHLLSRAIPISFAPLSLWIVSSRSSFPSLRRWFFIRDKRQTHLSQNLSMEHNDQSVKLPRKLQNINTIRLMLENLIDCLRKMSIFIPLVLYGSDLYIHKT